MVAFRAGVIGQPISHSLSPRLHSYWLNSLKIDGQYSPYEVSSENLETFLKSMSQNGMRGCNVTLPHKQTAFQICDELDAVAHAVGAVNTITVKENGQLLGSNTDAFGFQRNVETQPDWTGISGLPNNKALVLGAGGAARAIIYALKSLGFATIYLVNRSKNKAEIIAHEMPFDIRPTSFDRLDTLMSSVAMLVNTTILGMKGAPTFDFDISRLPKNAWVSDLIYNPLETPLINKARAQNLHIIDGLNMLLYQAIPGFMAWFDPPKTPEVTPALRRYMLDAVI